MLLANCFLGGDSWCTAITDGQECLFHWTLSFPSLISRTWTRGSLFKFLYCCWQESLRSSLLPLGTNQLYLIFWMTADLITPLEVIHTQIPAFALNINLTLEVIYFSDVPFSQPVNGGTHSKWKTWFFPLLYRSVIHSVRGSRAWKSVRAEDRMNDCMLSSSAPEGTTAVTNSQQYWASSLGQHKTATANTEP